VAADAVARTGPTYPNRGTEMKYRIAVAEGDFTLIEDEYGSIIGDSNGNTPRPLLHGQQ
jgi:hypothetical protein